MPAAKERSIITDKVVVAKTGATMEDWFRHLDSLGAKKMTSTQIYELLASVEGLKPLGQWNQGLLSTSYQWSRGLRERGEKKDGFEISGSKTINVPLSVIYKAFVDVKLRHRWLPEKLEITKKTENKSARAAWTDGTRVSVDFYSKGEEKAQIVVQHLKLPDAKAAEKMKAFWNQRLAALTEQLED